MKTNELCVDLSDLLKIAEELNHNKDLDSLLDNILREPLRRAQQLRSLRGLPLDATARAAAPHAPACPAPSVVDPASPAASATLPHPGRTFVRMARVKTVFRCGECGGESPRWLGRCPTCEAWNSLVEELAEEAGIGLDIADAEHQTALNGVTVRGDDAVGHRVGPVGEIRLQIHPAHRPVRRGPLRGREPPDPVRRRQRDDREQGPVQRRQPVAADPRRDGRDRSEALPDRPDNDLSLLHISEPTRPY